MGHIQTILFVYVPSSGVGRLMKHIVVYGFFYYVYVVAKDYVFIFYLIAKGNCTAQDLALRNKLVLYIFYSFL